MPLHSKLLLNHSITAIFRRAFNPSIFYQFKTRPVIYSSFASKPISRFSLCNNGSRSISHALKATVEDEVKNHEKESCDYSPLKEKLGKFGINYNSCTPGQYHLLICPKCKGGRSTERSLSFHISQNRNLAIWRCSLDECGCAGQILLDSQTNGDGLNRPENINSFRLSEESLKLEPLGDELIAYFAGRMISKETLEKNHVMQMAREKKIIAFTYRRNETVVGCKYRSLEKRYWQEKGTQNFLYGVDDIRDEDEIVIVEGEIDKLSMEEAGISNCVSVPDGAPQIVSVKELPAMEKDTRFKYIWNSKEYLNKASRIIIATDADVPGQALAEELARRLGRERCWRVHWPKKDEFSCFKDANEVLMNLGPNSLRETIYGM